MSAGSTGCVLANRLSADKEEFRATITIVEHGISLVSRILNQAPVTLFLGIETGQIP